MKLCGILIAVVTLAACGSADDSKDLFGAKVCVAGATQECVCPGSVKGAQACLDDGSGWGACDCGGGSGAGGSAGGGQDAGGTAGAGGSCTPRKCPATAEDGGAPTCGQVDDGCGGKLDCGCAYGACVGGACSCWHAKQWDFTCSQFGDQTKRTAIQCDSTVKQLPNCTNGPGPIDGNPEFPSGALCCP